MTTQAQLLANRANGQKSHGPNSNEGKAICRRNSLKHGFLSTTEILLPNEDPSEFEAFQEGMRADLQPTGELEKFLFSQIVGYAWRLRRCQAIEGSILSYGMGSEKVDRSQEKARRCFEGYPPMRFPSGELLSVQTFSDAGMEEVHGQMERDSPSTILGAGFSRGESGFRLLSRYETALTRNLTRNLGLFFEAQRTRRYNQDIAVE